MNERERDLLLMARGSLWQAVLAAREAARDIAKWDEEASADAERAASLLADLWTVVDGAVSR